MKLLLNDEAAQTLLSRQQTHNSLINFTHFTRRRYSKKICARNPNMSLIKKKNNNMIWYEMSPT